MNLKQQSAKFSGRGDSCAIRRLLIVLLCLNSATAFAQAAPGAGEILQTVPPAVVRPDSGPSIDDSLSKSKAVADVEGMQLEINGFRVTGLTVASEAEMTGALAAFVGPNKRFQDLLDAAAAVKRELAGRGYFLADVIVPEQKISDGVVELRVLEGRLGKVRLEVDADAPISRALLESYIGSLEEGELIRTGDVERALFQIHDLRGIVASSSFAPGATAGTADLTIKVRAGKKFDANLDFDANGSIYTGLHRVGGGVDGNGLFGYGELINLRASNAIDGNLRFARASALVPVGPWGSKVGVAYSELKYRLGTPLFSGLKANGSAVVESFIGIHPIVRSRNANLLAILQADKRKFEDIRLTTNIDTRKISDVNSLALSGDFRDRLGGGGINVFNVAYTLGEIKYAPPTAGADRTNERIFSKTNLTLARLQSLPAISDRLAFYGAFSQQFTNKNLDASEKFSLGGPNGVRAYPQGEGSGDEGYFANLELRYRLPLEDNLPGTLVLAGFYDFGRSILIKKPTLADLTSATPTPLRERIAGPGIGLNWEVPNDWYLRTTLAFRDTGKATADHLLRYPRFYFQFSKFF
ncbi:MAG: ShlB/FhaC/HecB family hemolysin secretion/activation protein [Sulfuritalea sp.]|nr:ShlB/FhaC/HecB family hemolysin secretion/activation protein [Sulfuritalea sp.]MDP1981115.1 ShlB/FhaC/HecB family hemolysin secretion/activation protein [Sulfuritalea sp.]